MKRSKLVRFLMVTMIVVVFAACSNDKHSGDDIQKTAVTTDSIVPIAESAEETIDSVYYYWPEKYSGFQYSVIELVFKGKNVLSGYFWGTSDEFEDVREGYYPGFMVLPMQNIEQKGDTLNFVLDSSGHPFYSSPVSIYVHDPVKEHCDTLHAWLQKDDQWWDRVKYTAVLSRNGKVLTVIDKSKYEYFKKEPHTFYAFDRDVLAKILPRMPEDNDVANRWETEFSVPKDSIYK